MWLTMAEEWLPLGKIGESLPEQAEWGQGKQIPIIQSLQQWHVRGWDPERVADGSKVTNLG